MPNASLCGSNASFRMWDRSPCRPERRWGLNSIGAIGGMDWGGVSIDPERGYAFANVVEHAHHDHGDPTTRRRERQWRPSLHDGNVRFQTMAAKLQWRPPGRAWSPSIWRPARSNGAWRWVGEENMGRRQGYGRDHHRPHLGDAGRHRFSRRLRSTVSMSMTRAGAGCCGR
jgi:hypothetical protein